MINVQSLLKSLLHTTSSIHATRLTALIAAVQALTSGAKANVTSLGRHLASSVRIKHKIKRMDRLLSNPHLYQERSIIYRMLARRILQNITMPIVIIDWSPLCADQRWQLLRASLPVGGRSLTLYEEIHPQAKLGNRKTQHQFLGKLNALMPGHCAPIIVADAGFKTPFYRYIEQLQWHWVGRIRARDFICMETVPDQWFSAKSLYSKATLKAKKIGIIQWVRSNPLVAVLILIRQKKKGRQDKTFQGRTRQSRRHQVHASREREPWLLVTSQSLQNHSAKQIVKLYRVRMQIEEGFRDTKALRYGLALSQYRHMNAQRRAILCLLASLAIFVLWCVGVAAKAAGMMKNICVNSTSKHESYSVIFLARLLMRESRFRLPRRQMDASVKSIKPYLESILCA